MSGVEITPEMLRDYRWAVDRHANATTLTNDCCIRIGLAEVLGALGQAGRLLPDAGETHTETEERPDIGPATRIVIVWPDGTELARPWEPFRSRNHGDAL